VLRQTRPKRLHAQLSEVKAELKRRMHQPVPKVAKWLRSVVAGHNRCYGVTMNWAALSLFRFPGGLALAARPVVAQPERPGAVGPDAADC